MTSLRVPGFTVDEQGVLSRLLEKLEAKAPRNFLRASFYDGKRALSQVGSVIPPQYYRLGIVLGWSGKAVDSLARRCNLDAFVWPDGDLDSLGMREFADSNRLFAEFKSGMVSSLIHGPAFAVNTTGNPGGGEPKSLLHLKDAMSATGDWSQRKRALENLLSITSRDGDGNVDGFTLYLNNLTITAEKDSSGWEIDRQEHPWGVPAEVLVYKPRVGREFGQSRISRPLMSLHERGLQTIIRLEGHMDVYSYPEMWMLGADPSIFKNSDGSQKASWQVMLGRIKGIPDDSDADPQLARADVKQFPASTPEPHLKALNAYAKLFAREASLPDADVAISDTANATSADSYEQSREGLIAEAEGATDDWTVPVQRAVARGLAIFNDEKVVPESWQSLDPKWRDPRFLSRAAQADAGMKQLAAIPWLGETEVGLELLGLSSQQITRAVSERARAQSRNALGELVRVGAERLNANADSD